MPGQLLLHVEHPTTDNFDQLARDITNNFKHFLDDYIIPRNQEIQPYLLEQIAVTPDQIITLLDKEGKSRSLIPIRVTADEVGGDGFDSQVANSRIIPIVETAFEFLGKESFVTEDGIVLVSLSPNWTLSNSQGAFTGTGGPGSRPVPPEPFTGSPPYEFTMTASVSTASYAENYIRLLMNNCAAADVDIIILDTIPSRDIPQLQADFGSHQLIQQLCQNLQIHTYDTHVAPALKVKPVMQSLNDHLSGVAIKGHDYEMSDHGLFIAGIIHSIAPQSQLHLVQVLDKWGVGTLETIANGIRYALGLRADRTQQPEGVETPVKRPLIVNCSFTVNLPLPEYESIIEPGKIYYKHPSTDLAWPKIDNYTSMVQYLFDCVQFAFSPIIHTDILVAAAAGNDSIDGEDRVQSRLPAQLPNVIGVASLKRTLNAQDKYEYELSEYSNIADKPESDGVAVFGGNMAQGSPQADTVDGILGIYTGSFPDHSTPASTDSEYGWARWAGTSFATPIIAGVLALLRSDGKLAAQAKKTIEDTIIETPVGTHIFLVDQK
jgi:hypothetical protein